MSELRDAALIWASEGYPVFPCKSNKTPATAHGVKDATTDIEALERYSWDAAIGGATGAPSGVWVLDIDGPVGEASLSDLILRHHATLPTTLTVRTPRGTHYHWRVPADRDIRNSAGKVAPGIDVRGTGGYAILPPSNGGVYRLIGDTTQPVDAPGWLLDLVCPPIRDVGKAERIRAFVREACDAIRAAPEGSRNDTVNRRCYSIGGFLADAGLSQNDVQDDLIAAALAAEQTAASVIAALRAGAEHPRPMPDDRPIVWDPAPRERDDASVPNDVWSMLEISDATNKPTKKITNLVAILSHDPRWSDSIRYNEFTCRKEMHGKPIIDADVTRIVCEIADIYGVEYTNQRVYDVIDMLSRDSQYHPVRAYLESLQWDGAERLPNWLPKYAGVENGELVPEYGIKWMISAVARIMQPGCQADSVLVLYEPIGGRGKTALVRALGTLEWTSDQSLPIGNKDANQQIQGVWIQELSELAMLRRSEIEAIRGFITIRVDRFRPPFGRSPEDFPRQTVFLGTTNDPTPFQSPDRRWWVCKVVRDFDPAEVLGVRDQLWAEAVARYRRGEPWHLGADERMRAIELGEEYVQPDPLIEPIAKIIYGRLSTTMTDIMEGLGIPIERRKGMAQQVACSLKRLGFDQKRKSTINGARVWVYYRSNL